MLADIPQLPGFLSVIFRLIETRRTKSDRNCLCSKPNQLAEPGIIPRMFGPTHRCATAQHQKRTSKRHNSRSVDIKTLIQLTGAVVPRQLAFCEADQRCAGDATATKGARVVVGSS